MTDSCHIWFVILFLEVTVMKYNWRIQEKQFYLPKDKPELINVPKTKYLCIKGKGNPNNEDFSNRIAILYKLSYTIKMLPRKDFIPKGYYEYTVYPLEGLWNISKQAKESFNKDDLFYTIMIKQPDFVNEEIFLKAYQIVKNKVAKQLLDEVYLDDIEAGLAVQMLHIGSYDNEKESFKKMQTFISNNGLKRKTSAHREIYLSNAKKVQKDQLKTVLRYMVERNEENNHG